MLLQGQPTVVSCRVTNSGYVLMATPQQSSTELVLLVDASLATALLSDQCDVDVGTDLI